MGVVTESWNLDYAKIEVTKATEDPVEATNWTWSKSGTGDTVDQASADSSDSFIPVEQFRPMESILPADSPDTSETTVPPIPRSNETASTCEASSELCLLGTSDAFAPTDFFLV